MTSLQAIAICAIVAMTTLQSWILMRVVKRLMALESALRAMWKRSLIEEEPAGSMSAIGGSRPSRQRIANGGARAKVLVVVDPFHFAATRSG